MEFHETINLCILSLWPPYRVCANLQSIVNGKNSVPSYITKIYILINTYMLCTSGDFIQVATCTKSLYKLQLVQAVCTSCNSYKIGFYHQIISTCTILLYQLDLKRLLVKLTILLKIFLILCV